MRRLISWLVVVVLGLGMLTLTGCPKKVVKEEAPDGDTVENPDPRPKPG
ncbi:MAG TPA: hypothetical protein PK668_04475 [Myxococcota bacterium]|nr:hypothetical protein [Myxococcota bacterium]HRY92115.1 hypothetical protein [Myxococcota bacterium]HSA20938.1 hypothetical protein [Myxococcota bacterium]